MPEPILAEDFLHYRLVSDPRVSPDGSAAVYVEQRADAEKNAYFSNLRLVRLTDGEDRPLTQGEQRDRSPRWSPCGRWVAFLSDRGETTQIWAIRADGGEAEAWTTLPEGSIGSLAWSPDGSRLAFSYRPNPAWATRKAREEREKAKRSTPPIVVRRLAYREEGVGYFGDERWHLQVLDVATRAVTQVTHGDHDQGDFCWSPDGAELAFVTNRSADPDVTPYLKEIRVVPAAGGEERLIPAAPGPKGHLSWSPDGKWLAFAGHTDARDVWGATDPHVWILPAAGGEGRDLLQQIDRPAGDWVLGDLQSFGGGESGPLWLPDSRGVLALVSDCGASHLYYLPREGAPQLLTPGLRGEVGSVSLAADGSTLVCGLGTPMAPNEVHVGDWNSGPLALRAVTRRNAEFLAGRHIREVEEVRAPRADGEVHGWLIRPDREGVHPLILYIHGGPHTQYGWSYFHEFQALAARGFAVLFTNPRGSRGYGQDHVTPLRGHWGGPDTEDVLAAVEHVAALPGIDGNRVGVTGGSYGGFLTNWLVGHTRRFRAAVTQRSVTNLHSMSGTCDFNFSESDYFGGNAWSEPAEFLRQSPLTYAGEVDTPLLILHSEGDLRCPMEQAEQWFAALKRRGCTVEFVRYPRETNHGLTRGGPPDLRLDSLNRVADWFTHYLQPDATRT